MIVLSPSGIDDTIAIQAALDSDLIVSFLDGDFLISDALELRSFQSISFVPSTKIKQATPNKSIFVANGKSNINMDFRRGTLFGEGAWSSGWTGSNGHYDQGIRLVGCRDIHISTPTIKNCAHSGIAVIGGENIHIDSPVIEGTHLLGAPLPSQANYQSGIFVQDVHATGATSVTITHANISNVAQGFLIETYPGIDCLHRNIQITSPFVHDIPGQHAFYIQSGNVSITNPVMHDIELAGVKVQSSADNNQHIRNIVISDAVGVRVKSNFIEMASLGSGSISNVRMSGIGDTIGTGIAIVGNVNDLKADVVLYDAAAHAVLIQGAGADDIDIKVFARNIGQHGIVVSTTNAYNLKLRPTLRNPNTSNILNQNGLVVAMNNQSLDIIDPDITDSAGRIRYGMYNSMSPAKVRGYSNIIGANVASTYGPFV